MRQRLSHAVTDFMAARTGLLPSVVSSSSVVERTQIKINDGLPSSAALQSTLRTAAAWLAVLTACARLALRGSRDAADSRAAAVQLPLTAGSHYCNAAFFSPFFFFLFPFYGLAEEMLHRRQCVQSAACRILTPSQGLSGCHCPSGGSRAGSLSNITLILKLL